MVLIESMDSDSDVLKDAFYTAHLGIAEARSSLVQRQQLRAERARSLHEARRKLHRALIVIAEAMAKEGAARRSSISGFEPPARASLLTLRQMFSAFRGGLISAGEQRARLSWALEVASSELSVLRAHPVVNDLAPRSQQVIHDLARRVTAWGLRQPDLVLGRALYREASMIPAMADDLSTHPLLVEHDEQSLSELSALLANEPSGAPLESNLLGHLSNLRGLDAELDRLELALVYGAAGVLGTLSMRVADLRARLSPPSRAAASWS